MPRHKPLIVQPALIDRPDQEEQSYWPAVTHPNKCVNDTDYSKLIGMEVSFVEQQAAMFQYDARIKVRSVFDARLGDWGDLKSDWGSDLCWCGIVQETLLQSLPSLLLIEEPMLPYRGRETCHVERLERNASRPVACMIVQATPVLHQNTQSYHDEGTTEAAVGWEARRKYQDELPEYFQLPCLGACEGARVGFYRSFWMDVPCQHCRDWDCIHSDSAVLHYNS